MRLRKDMESQGMNHDSADSPRADGVQAGLHAVGVQFLYSHAPHTLIQTNDN